MRRLTCDTAIAAWRRLTTIRVPSLIFRVTVNAALQPVCQLAVARRKQAGRIFYFLFHRCL
jgi:hypothetical protein